MMTQAVWEDDETNREVSLSINYAVDSEGITITGVTPTRVFFPRQNRSVLVWTEKGQRLLMRQLRASGRLDEIRRGLEGELLATAAG
jgi:hypothetical protein